MERVRGWIKAHPMVWVVGVLVAGLIVGAAIGASSTSSLKNEKKELEQRLASTQSERDKAEAEVSGAMSRASRVEGLRGKIVGEAEEKAASILGSAKTETAQEKEAFSSLKGEVESTESELESVEGALGSAREEKAKSTISDGTWQAEVDYIPGTYEAEGGASCYWAEESEPGGGTGVEGIIENGGFNKHQILSITSPYFETRGCGTWKRVGE